MDGSDHAIRVLQAELISRFADDVAHEIRNPLNALVINIEVLRRRVAAGDAEAAGSRIDVIAQEVSRVHTSIERFIALLRPLLHLRAAAIRASLETAPPDGAVALPRDRLRFALLDAAMAGFDRLGTGGHLSCTVAGDDHFVRVVWRGRAGEAGRRSEARLAGAIANEAGGTLHITDGPDDAFEISLALPRVA